MTERAEANAKVALYLFFASQSKMALILRQSAHKIGRRKVQMSNLIHWNREDDSFQEGQWLNANVLPECCDLSPDGAHFIYYAHDPKWANKGPASYSAISHPPFFTALAFFPQDDIWGAKAAFLDNTRFALEGRTDDTMGGSGLSRAYIHKDGPPHFVDAHGKPLLFNQGTPPPPYPICRPVDADYQTEGGQLFKVSDGNRALIRDFTEMAFTPLRAPYDARPEQEADAPPWHPLET